MLADVDRLGDGLVHGMGFVADVGGVAGAVGFQDATQGAQLVALAEAARRGEQAGRQAERAGLQPLRQHVLHVAQLRLARRAVFHAHRHQAKRVVADLHHGVHRDVGPAVHVAGEVGFLEGQPGGAARQILAERVDLAGQCRRDGEAAIADHLGRHPLADLGLGLRVERQGEVGMGMDVDEARGHHAAVGVDDATRAVRPVRLDGDDAAGADGHIGHAGRRAGAIDHLAAPDHDVVHHRLPSREYRLGAPIHERPSRPTSPDGCRRHHSRCRNQVIQGGLMV